jgi:polyisoprenoid-binding protein YceI
MKSANARLRLPLPLLAVAVVPATLVVAGFLGGCDNKPAKDKPVAQVAEPVATTPPTQAPATQAATYRISPEASKIEWVGAKVTGKHDGSFEQFTGSITMPGNDPVAGSVDVTIDMASVKSDNEKLTGHLKSPDFFDVEKHPKARFTSTSIRAGGEKGATHTITGNLEFHGVTKSITFPATIKPGGDSVEVDSEFAINRKDFSIVYPGKPDDLIKDDVLIKLKLRAPKNA